MHGGNMKIVFTAVIFYVFVKFWDIQSTLNLMRTWT